MEVKCQMCGETKTVSCTPEQYAAWKSGQLIQNAMPNVPRAERELLISKTCGPCFDTLFGKDEDGRSC